MNVFTGIFISDEKNNSIFEYPLSNKAPFFQEIKTKILSINHKKEDFLESKETLPVVIKLNNDVNVYYYYTKYLRFYLSCEIKKEIESESDGEEEEADDDNEDNDESSEDEFRDNDYNEFNEDEDEDDKEDIKSTELLNSYNPLIPLEFLTKLIETLNDYFGKPLIPIKLETNYDILCLIINEMIENNYPFITDLNQLKELIQFDNVLSSLIPTNNSSSNLNSKSHGISSQDYSLIPWRKPNVKYTNNELFVDFIETITLIMSSNSNTKSQQNINFGSSAFYSTNNNNSFFSKPIIAKIQGEILLNSQLSGIPDLQMILNLNNHDLKIPRFHPCINIDKWKSSNGTVMSFIPPDGKCCLGKYEIDLIENSMNNNLILKNIGIIQGNFKTELGLLKNEFEINLNISNLKSIKNIDNLIIEINTKTLQDEISSIKILRLSIGDFQYNINGKHLWIFDKNLITGINPILRGTIIKENEDSKQIFPDFVSLSYNYKGALPSGIKVSSLKVVGAKGLGNNIKPYKGVKYITKTGQVILR